MTFDELLAQVLELLQREKRLSYRALKVRFGLDDEHLEALKDEIIEAKQLAVDDKGRVLVWTGYAASAPPPTAALMPARAPLATIPAYLAEKIHATRGALEGECKQVMVLFADLKDSTELIRGLDPEAAQQLLDPALHHMMEAVHRFEGTVNQVLGDGIMALFGAPIAHEDHALRACYAALAMQAATRAYTQDTHAQAIDLRLDLRSALWPLGEIGRSFVPLQEAEALAEAQGNHHRPGRVTAALLHHFLLTWEPDHALASGQRALEFSQAHQERGHEAYALRLLGEIAAHRDPPQVEQVETHYRQALALRPLQAHCHFGLGTLYAKIGRRREQARAELSAAITLYRAMEMTFWLPSAEGSAGTNVVKFGYDDSE